MFVRFYSCACDILHCKWTREGATWHSSNEKRLATYTGFLRVSDFKSWNVTCWSLTWAKITNWIGTSVLFSGCENEQGCNKTFWTKRNKRWWWWWCFSYLTGWAEGNGIKVTENTNIQIYSETSSAGTSWAEKWSNWTCFGWVQGFGRLTHHARTKKDEKCLGPDEFTFFLENNCVGNWIWIAQSHNFGTGNKGNGASGDWTFHHG